MYFSSVKNQDTYRKSIIMTTAMSASAIKCKAEWSYWRLVTFLLCNQFSGVLLVWPITRRLRGTRCDFVENDICWQSWMKLLETCYLFTVQSVFWGVISLAHYEAITRNTLWLCWEWHMLFCTIIVLSYLLDLTENESMISHGQFIIRKHQVAEPNRSKE